MIEELFAEALRWYNLPWSLMLLLVLLYWLIAIFGLVDLDFLGFDLGVDADADLDVDADVDVDVDANPGGGVLLGVMEFVHLGSLPLMVVVSGLVICAWSMALIANFYINSANSGFIGFGISLAVSIPGLIVSSLALWPVATFYKRLEDKTDGNLTMIGRTCRVRSDRVDAHYGQAEVSTSEGPLVINVRLASESEPLATGDSALIINQDAQQMLYTVRKIANEITKI
jgi:hypothetical protein